VNLHEYLSSLKAAPGDPNSPALTWFEDRATQEQEKAVGAWPYVILESLDENVTTPLYGHENVMSQVIDVAIYQQPTSGRTPNKTSCMALWEAITNAPHFVDANTYKRAFISLELVTRLEPRFDPSTGGLFGSVRFRLHSAHG
jgi:hypothetical protein